MTGLERLRAAGITPCRSCRWKDGEIEQPCREHLERVKWAGEDHVRKFPPMSGPIVRRSGAGYVIVGKVA